MIREQQVYDALNSRWQTGQTIRQKVAHNLGKRRDQIDVGPIYDHLDSLVAQGFAESREATLTEEQLQQRGGYGAKEYRKIGEKDYKEVPEFILQPVPV